MIPYDKVEYGVLYWAFVKRNKALDVIRVYQTYGNPNVPYVKGTDESMFNQHLEDYIVLAPLTAGADVMDEVSTLRIQGVKCEPFNATRGFRETLSKQEGAQMRLQTITVDLTGMLARVKELENVLRSIRSETQFRFAALSDHRGERGQECRDLIATIDSALEKGARVRPVQRVNTVCPGCGSTEFNNLYEGKRLTASRCKHCGFAFKIG